ncbi:hypothetical protein T440DRAFT_405377 [Plenodomus tracheiphilus IPT5]|uniref:Uncharacterized protein n=1 Tax=Plenodomus tracheiphilus IPT5 TaxID=1408161 RepID=A0A6A7ATP1_9PLEO|nr:hypothetical protein T440DRAFT_405377 [Plenodomus tracheiphilus IPT5]
MVSALVATASPQEAPVESTYLSADNLAEQKDDHQTQEETRSSILELQEALGPLLLARKHKCTCSRQHSKLPFVPSHGCPNTMPHCKPIKPNWTGAFQLFCFPRELCDQIYFHYLHRVDGYIWNRSSNWSLSSTTLNHTGDIVNLFLASRQVHAEAFAVFCCYNTVYLDKSPRDNYRKRLDDILRHFPYRPSRALQCLGNVYWSNSTRGNEDGASDSFLQILRDAHEMRTHFPRLRIFNVRYGMDRWSDGEGLFVDNSWSEERKMAKMLGWMRTAVSGSNVVPAAWVQWELTGEWSEQGWWAEREKSTMNRAYAMLVNECGEIEDLEESGRKWIEETSSQAARRSRRKT